MLTMGRYRLASLLDGTFALDGGGVFGVVPRARWEREAPADAHHRVRLANRCLVARDEAAGRCILVDDGMGDPVHPRLGEAHDVDRSAGGVDRGLAALGLARGDVTDVILTHLHLDHAGGTTRPRPGGGAELAFPSATYHLQRRHWQWAQAPSERDAGSFQAECLGELEHAGRLHLVEGEVELFPDLELIVSEGHTVAQQLPRFHGEGTHLTCCGDLIPTRAHLRVRWVMAYDLYPLTTIEEKKVLLAQALEDDGILFLAHDLEVAACRLREERGHPAFREAVAV